MPRLSFQHIFTVANHRIDLGAATQLDPAKDMSAGAGAMIDRAWALLYANEWAANWNARDLEAVLSHYDGDVVFRSPRIGKVLGNDQAAVHGIEALRDYWQKALDMAQAIHFEIEDVGVGGDAITIAYRNQRGERVAETLIFGANGKVIEGVVTVFTPSNP